MNIKIFSEFINENVSNRVIAYHGTPNGVFQKFSMRKRGSGADTYGVGDYGKGFYFSPNKDYALSYALNSDKDNTKPTLYKVELLMKNPLDLRILSKYNNSILELNKKYGVFNIPNEEYDRLYQSLNITETEFEFYEKVADLLNDNWGDWNVEKTLKEKGYDSLINYDGNEFIVYSNKQIKILEIIVL